jgi:UDP-N-acetylglucosamine 4,6-dehydratase/5-epimerase
MGETKVRYLITGGTGSFGSAFIKAHVSSGIGITVYSRDWVKQKQLRDELGNPSNIRWVIGDVRDKERLRHAIKVADTVIHAAAIKCIEACEQNPTECLDTNVIGTQNVIDAIPYNTLKAILISTDKAVMPINTYGASKKMAEKLWLKAGYSVCRYGNVIGSAGSVLPLYRKMIADGVKSLPVTDARMTRFWYPMQDAVSLVKSAIDNYSPSEMYIPRIPSIRIVDLCTALDMPYHEVGIREGEKLHEYMIAPDDVTDSAGYSSGNNTHFLTVDEIRRSIDGI